MPDLDASGLASILRGSGDIQASPTLPPRRELDSGVTPEVAAQTLANQLLGRGVEAQRSPVEVLTDPPQFDISNFQVREGPDFGARQQSFASQAAEFLPVFSQVQQFKNVQAGDFEDAPGFFQSLTRDIGGILAAGAIGSLFLGPIGAVTAAAVTAGVQSLSHFAISNAAEIVEGGGEVSFGQALGETLTDPAQVGLAGGEALLTAVTGGFGAVARKASRKAIAEAARRGLKGEALRSLVGKTVAKEVGKDLGISVPSEVGLAFGALAEQGIDPLSQDGINVLGAALAIAPLGPLIGGLSVRKQARAATTGLIRRQFQEGSRVQNTPNPAKPSTIAKFTDIFNDLEPINDEFAEQIRRGRGKISGELEDIRTQGKALGLSQEEIASAQGAARAGKLIERDGVFPLENVVDDNELAEILDHIDGHSLFAKAPGSESRKVLSELDTKLAVTNLVRYGRIPQLAQIANLRAVLGDQFADGLENLSGKTRRPTKLDRLLEVANLPRNLLSSFDLSATLRQGQYLTTAHPRIAVRAFKDQLRAFGSEDYALAFERQLSARTDFGGFDLAQIRRDSRLDLPSITGGIAEREEAFLSPLVERIAKGQVPGTGGVLAAPLRGFARGVRASERAFVTYLNKLRVDVFDAQARELIQDGVTPTNSPQAFRDLAGWLNVTTGREGIKGFDGPLINATFFSPRFFGSRIKLLPRAGRLLASPNTNPRIRKEVARQIATTWGLRLGIAGLAAYASQQGLTGEQVNVSLDPRDPTFLKLNVDDGTTIDLGAGEGQLYRLYSVMANGKFKDPQTGAIRDTDRVRAVRRFTRYKLSPLGDLPIKLLTGRTALGKEIGTDIPLSQVALEMMTPIAVQQAHETLNEHGAIGMALMVPEVLGLGVNIFKERGR